MKYDKQYYMLCEAGLASKYMLGLDETSDEGLEHLMSLDSLKRRVLGKGTVQIYNGNKSKFTPCDFHNIPEQMISDKFRQLLLPLDLPRVDFYYVDIKVGEKVWNDYFMMHIWNNYPAIHKGRSVIDGTYVDDDFFLEELSLDEDLLDSIPLNERLVFRLTEKPRFLFHESVVDILKSANLTGVSFLRVDGFSSGFMFDD